jgi:CBS domain-containing protein
LDANEPLSKALGGIMDTGTAVIITKSGKYFGIIDDRNVRQNVGENPAKVKCETVITKPPVILLTTGLQERTEAFLLGRFKALPVVDNYERPIGIITRVEVLKELLGSKAIPKVSVRTMMNSPVYVIDEKSSVGEARTKMKEYNSKRLVVIRKGQPVGVFSTLDLAGSAMKPKEKEGRALISEKTSVDDLKISGIYRPNVATIDSKSTVEEAVRKMIEKQVSNVVVVSDNEPVGVLAALDIFKFIKAEFGSSKIPIEISGLREETRQYHNEIRGAFENAVKKFAATYGITGVTIHVKETKSLYELDVHVNGHEKFIVSAENQSLLEATNIAVAELKKIFGRKKAIEKSRKVRTLRGGL